MRKALLACALLLLWGGWAEAQSCDGCGIGYRPSSLSSSGGTLTGQLALPAGSAAVPSLKIGVSSGFYELAAGTLGISLGGGVTGWFSTGKFSGYSDSYTLEFGIANDTKIMREAANGIQLGSDAATAAAQTLSAADSTGASQPGGQLNLSGGVGGAGGEPGAVAIVDGGTKPTCAAGIRGSIWYDAGGAGVADTFEVCAKAAADSYAWRVLATIP